MIATLTVNIYFYSKNLELTISSRRANISILIESKIYPVTTDYMNLTFNGYLRNEGSRATMIKAIEFGLIFPFDTMDQLVISFQYLGDITSALTWEDSTLIEEQTRPFVLTGQTYNDWNLTSPEEGFVRIIHDDGISVQEQTKTFPLE